MFGWWNLPWGFQEETPYVFFVVLSNTLLMYVWLIDAVYERTIRCVCVHTVYTDTDTYLHIYIYYTDVLNYCGHFQVTCDISHFARPVAEASMEIGSKFLDPERGSRTITIEALQTSNSVLQAGIARLVCFTSISLGLYIYINKYNM